MMFLVMKISSVRLNKLFSITIIKLSYGVEVDKCWY